MCGLFQKNAVPAYSYSNESWGVCAGGKGDVADAGSVDVPSNSSNLSNLDVPMWLLGSAGQMLCLVSACVCACVCRGGVF